MTPRKIQDLRHLGFGDFEREYADDRQPLFVDGQHDLERMGVAQPEKPFQNLDDELHRGVVVIQQHHLVKRRACGLWPGLGRDRGFAVNTLAMV